MSEIKKDFVVLSNSVAECKISLFGGNIISYIPKTEENDIFWLGELNKFDNVQAIRGGIPVCWPRFSEEKLNENLPRHGFARLSLWNLDSVFVDETKIEASLSLTPDTKYNIDLIAKLHVKITDKLECCLETTNIGDKEYKFSEALHSYFYVGDLNLVKIKGFDGREYKNLSSNISKIQNGDLVVNGEFDCSFANHTNDIEIEDFALKRKIIIEKRGSNSTVIWNPSKDLAEMSDGQYKNFICVEPANQGDNFVLIKPKETHKMAMTVRVNKL